MDKNYPTLKRSKKKLTYPTSDMRLFKPLPRDKIILQDVETMFDDLDSKGDDNFPSPSPEIHIPPKKKLMGQWGDVSPVQLVSIGDHAAVRPTSASPGLDIDADIPFTADGPVKTSSPIEHNADQKEDKEQNREEISASPVLFYCVGEQNQVSKPSEKRQKQDDRKEKSDSFISETVPGKSVQKTAAAETRTETESAPAPVSPARPEPATGAAEKPPRAKPELTSFLQKLREAGQSKPARAWVSQPKVVSPPPEPEEDFHIIEDNTPWYFSIPSRASKSSKEKSTKTSSSEKETKDTSGEARSVSENQTKESEAETDPNVLPTESLPEHSQTKAKKTETKKVKSKDAGKGRGTERKKVKQKAERTEQEEQFLQNKNVPKKKAASKQGKKTKTPRAEPEATEEQLPAPEDIGNLETERDLANENREHIVASSSLKGSSGEDDRLLGKRNRKPPGQWWMSCPQSPEKTPLSTRRHLTAIESGSSGESPVKTATGKRKTLKLVSSSSSDDQRPRAEEKNAKKSKIKKRERPAKTKQTEEFARPIQDRALDQDSDSSPLLFQHRERSMASEKTKFPKVYQNVSNQKLPLTPLSSREPASQAQRRRRRKAPGSWWEVNPAPEEACTQPQPKARKCGAARAKKPQKPAEGAVTLKQKQPPAALRNLNSTFSLSPPESLKTGADWEHTAGRGDAPGLQETQGPTPRTLSPRRSTPLRSGPASMIELENHEEDLALPSTADRPVPCVSDMFAPPLRPAALRPCDNQRLADWLQFLWLFAEGGATPEDFEWFSYEDRVMGLMVELRAGSFTSGKLLLGSFTKKPLWVDHSATTVFNVLTGAVSVVDDCVKSCYSPGQSFMVQKGHAYSLHNSSYEPAMLLFTRVYAAEPSA